MSFHQEMLAQGRLVSRTLISVKWLFMRLCHCVREHFREWTFHEIY